jgi:hypothetical protein
MMASFFHSKDARMASYRYRGLIPSRELGWPMNDESADIWIVSKIDRGTPAFIDKAHARGKHVVVDACDLHFQEPWYRLAIESADHVTAPTDVSAWLLGDEFGKSVTAIDDPYEFDEAAPHVQGVKLFWFGHASNYYSLEPWLPDLKSYDLRIMSNIDGAMPWSIESLKEQLAWADVVLIPETAPYKSANRAVEAIRRGCFVVAEPHESLRQIPGIWRGNLLKGVQWVQQNPQLTTGHIEQAQSYVRERFSPARVANAWRTIIEACASSWGVDISRGMVGSMLMASDPPSVPMSSAT